MPGGRHTALTITLTSQERQVLTRLLRLSSISAGYARRVRIILLLAEGLTLTEVAGRVGIARGHVYKWATRYLGAGIEGLQDKPGRRGRPPVQRTAAQA